MELETMNKLYLELSQFATATTFRELNARRYVKQAMQELDAHSPCISTVRGFLESAAQYLRDRED